MNKQKVINDWLKTYLIGPMEDTEANDGGRGWRAKLREELAKRKDVDGREIYVFDPTLEEQSKIGMESEEFHKKVQGWLASGNNDLIAEHGALIWKGKTYLEKSEEGRARLIHILGDVDYVTNSNFLIMRMEPKDRPCGTFMEAGIALEHNIPIYVIQTMSRTDYPGSFIHAVFATGGAFFYNETELLTYIDKKYKLKVKK